MLQGGTRLSVNAMTMKRIFYKFLSFILLFVAFSCSGELDVCPDEYVCVSVGIQNPHVRSASDEGRDVIDMVNILVFSSSTHELLYKDEIHGAAAEMYLQRDVLMECFFIVNAPAGVFEEVRDLSEFRALRSCLADNEEAYVMEGYLSRSFSSDMDVTVDLSRLSSRIHVGRVVPAFINGTLADSEIVFRGMYLWNVCEEIGYAGDVVSEPGQPARDGSNLYTLIYGSNVVDTTPLRTDAYLYCYSGDHPTASVSATMLVIEFSIAGVPNYYSVQLPKLVPNNEYRIQEIRLLGLGTDVPGEIIDRIDLSYTVVVNPWGESEDREHVMN